MIGTEEQRRAQRCSVRLPLRIIAADGRAVNCIGQTRDMGAGGVRFIVPAELPPGTVIDYVVTLSTYSPAAHIRCTGEVLRCAESVEAPNPSYELAATMRRYNFVPQAQVENAGG